MRRIDISQRRVDDDGDKKEEEKSRQLRDFPEGNLEIA